MLSPVLGHRALRAALASQTGSFALLGPAGVGKHAVVEEWTGTRPSETLTSLGLARAVLRPSVVHRVDATTITDWTPWLRALEEDTFTAVILSDTDLPAPVASRLPIFRAGYLDDADVAQVLATTYPHATPRPLITRLAMGSLDGIDLLTDTAAALPALDRALAERTYPDLRHPLPLLHGLRAIARTVLGLRSVAVSEAARAAVTRRHAADILTQPVPATKHEARNMLVLTLARLHG